MRALTWQGKRDVRVENVPDPRIEQPTDAVVRLTSTCICGSDLHLYETLGAFMEQGDIIGHEPMGIVEEVGPDAAGHLQVGDRVVVPFNISCGHCWMCQRGLYAQCETTQNPHQGKGKGASLFGYTKLYGHVPGAQAEYLRVPMAHFGPIKVPEGYPDERFLYLSDVVPTAWQSVVYADVPQGGSVAVLGLGPIGQMAVRVARLRGAEKVYAVDLVPERLAMARRHGAETIDLRQVSDLPAYLRDRTDGRGPDSVIEAVGMDAHGNPVAWAGQQLVAARPSQVAAPLAQRFGVDRLTSLLNAVYSVRRGGTVSVIGVYGGAVDPLPMVDLFDRGIQLRMGQAHVRRWIDDIMPHLMDDSDPLGTGDLATHRLSLEQAPDAYDMFMNKRDGCIKVVLQPST
jgi:threonine dehydrogenase-like Zn-dependent dehydrogenase